MQLLRIRKPGRPSPFSPYLEDPNKATKEWASGSVVRWVIATAVWAAIIYVIWSRDPKKVDFRATGNMVHGCPFPGGNWPRTCEHAKIEGPCTTGNGDNRCLVKTRCKDIHDKMKKTAFEYSAATGALLQNFNGMLCQSIDKTICGRDHHTSICSATGAFDFDNTAEDEDDELNNNNNDNDNWGGHGRRQDKEAAARITRRDADVDEEEREQDRGETWSKRPTRNTNKDKDREVRPLDRDVARRDDVWERDEHQEKNILDADQHEDRDRDRDRDRDAREDRQRGREHEFDREDRERRELDEQESRKERDRERERERERSARNSRQDRDRDRDRERGDRDRDRDGARDQGRRDEDPDAWEDGIGRAHV